MSFCRRGPSSIPSRVYSDGERLKGKGQIYNFASVVNDYMTNVAGIPPEGAICYPRVGSSGMFSDNRYSLFFPNRNVHVGLSLSLGNAFVPLFFYQLI